VRGAMACVARVCAPATAATRVVRGEKPDVAWLLVAYALGRFLCLQKKFIGQLKGRAIKC
jgi:hypothetical protein